MNFCTECKSVYEKPGTCNCYAPAAKPVRLTPTIVPQGPTVGPYVPYTPPMWTPQSPWWGIQNPPLTPYITYTTCAPFKTLAGTHTQ